MKIKITDNNRDKIDTVLKKANGRATARLADYDDCLNLVSLAETRLTELRAAKTAWMGSMAAYQETVGCNSYKYRADATRITIEYGSSAWFLVDVERCQTKTARGCADSHIEASDLAIESARNAVYRSLRGVL